MSEFMIVYNIISHIPSSQTMDKSTTVRVADSYGSEKMAKDALFELMISDFNIAQRDGTVLTNKRSFSLQKMSVRMPQKISADVPVMPLEKPNRFEDQEPKSSYNPYLERVIYEERDLSIRARNGLMNDGCVTIADVTKKTAKELMRIPNFGKSSLIEVKAWLQEMYLGLSES